MKLRRIFAFGAGGLVILFLIAWALASFYKKEIIQTINEQISSSINGTVQIEDADFAFLATFPNVSLRLEGVTLQIKNDPGRPLVQAGKIFASIRLSRLLVGRIEFRSLRIENANVFVYRSQNGKLNVAGLRKTEGPSTEGINSLLELTHGELDFRNVQITYQDSIRNKYFGFRLERVTDVIELVDSTLHQHLQGKVFFDSLTFAPERGSFLRETNGLIDLRVRQQIGSRQLVMDSSTLALNKSLLSLRLSLHQPDSGFLRLEVRSDNLDFEEGLSVIPRTMSQRLRSIRVARPFQYAIEVVAPLGKKVDPLIRMRFATERNNVRAQKLVVDSLSVHGVFTNQLDSLQIPSNTNTEIHFYQLSAQMQQLPLEAEVWVTNLNDMNLRLESLHRFDLARLNVWLDSTQWKIQQGTFESRFKYEGKVSEYLDSASTQYQGHLSGRMRVDDGKFQWVPRKLNFEQLQARVQFNQDTVWVDTLALRAGSNELTLSGLMGNFVPFFVGPSTKASVRLRVTSPSIDLGTLLVKKTKQKKTKSDSKVMRQRLSQMLDQLLSSVDLQLSLGIKKLKNRNFSATDVSGILRWGKNRVEATGLKMKFGGGTVTSSMLVRNLERPVSPIEWKANCSQVDIGVLFRSFGNFNQTVIQDKNLEGTISTSVHLTARMDDDFNLTPGSFAGPIQFTVRNGAINELPAFQTLSSFLLKRRDFDHVKFAQIDGTMKVVGTELEIDRMEIQSTVLGLFLEGTYSLKDKTDLTIQIPLSNLKKRDQSFVPPKMGTASKAGASVFLVAKPGDDGKLALSYDLFHKFRKKK